MYLLSWIPSEFVALADVGINANPEQCLQWVVDVEHEFIQQLQQEGLLG
jgi:hypothetical protein